jgi:hypothetical protein
MGSTTVQARFGEDTYPIGRFISDRARALGISRTELVRRLGYRQICNGHRALAELLTTGTVPPLICKASRRRFPSGQGARRRRHLGDHCAATIRMAARIASPEMLSDTELLPHLICSPPIGGGGDIDEAG